MMDFNERVIPGITANFQFKESLARYKFAKKIFGEGQKVLDIGCGTGYGTALIGDKCDVIGIDSSKDAIEYAKRHYSKKSKFLVADALDLPFKNNEFDAACSFEVIEHVKNTDKFLKEVVRILKPKSKFILSTPNAPIYSPGGQPKSPYHVKEYTAKELASLLSKFFKTVNIKGQTKSRRVKIALKDFMVSQEAREKFVKSDILGIRKIIPRGMKEKTWKYLGAVFGRQSQESLETKDFPIKSENVSRAEYLIAICEK